MMDDEDMDDDDDDDDDNFDENDPQLLVRLLQVQQVVFLLCIEGNESVDSSKFPGFRKRNLRLMYMYRCKVFFLTIL